MDALFQVGRKSIHHLMSARASLFKVMWWCNLLTLVEMSISLRTKIRPGLTTLQTKDNFPIIDQSSFLVHFRREFQKGRISRSSAYLSSGMRMVRFDESKGMPK